MSDSDSRSGHVTGAPQAGRIAGWRIFLLSNMIAAMIRSKSVELLRLSLQVSCVCDGNGRGLEFSQSTWSRNELVTTYAPDIAKRS